MVPEDHADSLAIFAGLLATPSLEQVVDHGEHARSRQGKKQRDGQVVCHPGHDPRELDKSGHDYQAIVVVVDVAASKPRVVRREVAALQNGVQIGHVHWLLAAHPRVPQVRVAHTNQIEEQEEGKEQHLVDHDESPPSTYVGDQQFPLLPGQQPTNNSK